MSNIKRYKHKNTLFTYLCRVGKRKSSYYYQNNQGKFIMGKYKIPNVKTFEYTKIIGLENIEFGKNIIIDDFAFIYAKGKIKLGNYVHNIGFTFSIDLCDSDIFFRLQLDFD